MSLPPRTRLGPYEILSLLGAGGMGEVYRARDTRLQRDVAVKVLPASYAADPNRLRRFEQEARAAGALNHPNITAVYDIGSHEGAPYVVSELLEGQTFRSALSGVRLPTRKVMDYALQITQGLAAAHEKGIIHRDLKPENLFITRDGRVKILDFGLAKLMAAEGVEALTEALTVDGGTKPGTVMGSLGYMSPEQVRGKPTDARSDLFCFGAILYEMLAGKRAFQGDSGADVLSAILREEPAEISTAEQEISPALERVVRHCLEKEPEARFHSAHDLAFALEAVSTGSGAAMMTETPARRAPRRALIGATVALLLVITAVSGGFLAGRRTSAGSKTTFPMFHRLTFRHGGITSARFAPDGQTIVYAGAWDGRPTELFTTRADAIESRSLGLPTGDVLSISSLGEMAINLIHPVGEPDMLARVSLAGGAPREISESILVADWAPDGRDLAVIRTATGRRTLEFPIGKVLYESPDLYDLRVSPRGDRIAILEGNGEVGSLAILDLAGRKTPLLSEGLAWGLAWAPSGDEIWLILGRPGGIGPSLHAVSMTGKVREIYRSPGMLVLCDLSRDGRILMGHATWRADLYWLRTGETREQDVSWLDWSIAADLSADGKTLLFNEWREGGDGVYLRRGLNEPAVRLGDWAGLAMSPDGRWVLATTTETTGESRLVLLPTGAGEPKTLVTGPISSFDSGRFFADQKRIVISGTESGKPPRLWVLDLSTGVPRPISPEGTQKDLAVTPDGSTVAARFDDLIQLFPVEAGEPRVMPGQKAGEVPICWDADGRFLYVYHPMDVPLKVYRVDAQTGKRDIWKSIDLLDTAGAHAIGNLLVAPIVGSYSYSVQRTFSDLYVLEGLE